MQLHRLLVPLIALMALAGHAHALRAADGKRPPNIVIIFTDDQGYTDVGCYGAQGIKTPNLDRMASQGMRFTDFYVPQPVCSSSRAGLMTGCYPNRVGIVGALNPGSKLGINASEWTIADIVKQKSYATAAFGKWHLGHRPEFLPKQHGFDEYFGLPYSNDMWPKHPTAGKIFPPLPLIDGDKQIELNPDQTKLTTWYTERAVKFIEKNRAQPFFLYVAHNMPHVPLHVSEKFAGKSAAGIYGDVIEEIDWSVGQILEAISRCNIDNETLVIFTCDNGPWLSYGDHAGTAHGLREGKATTFEGGVREPCIMRWPGHVPAGAVCREPAMTIDLLPTIANLVEAPLPTHKIDGLDISPLILGKPDAKSPHNALYFYWLERLDAVRSGRWKLHLPHTYAHISEPGTGGMPGKQQQKEIGLALFDLETDPGETTDVAASHPDVVKQLQALAEAAREDLGDSATKRKGTNVREPGRI